MEYASLLQGVQIGLLAQEPHLMEVVSLVDQTINVYAAQLIRSQRMDPDQLEGVLEPKTLEEIRAQQRNHDVGYFPRDYLYVGLVSELPDDPVRAPHDCICIADMPLPEAYTAQPLDINLILFHTADRPNALLDTLNSFMFSLSDDGRYYHGIERISVAEHRHIGLTEAVTLAASLMSNPTLLVDERGYVLGYGPIPFTSTALMDEIHSGMLSPEMLHQLRQESIYDLLYPDLGEHGHLAWDFFRYLCIPIRVRGLRVAELIVQNSRTAFHNSKLRLSAPIARLLGSIIEHQMETHNDQALLHNLLFSALLRVTSEQYEDLRSRIAEMHWQEQPGMRLFCFKRNGNGAEDAFERLRLAHPGCRWTTAEHYHLMLLYPEHNIAALALSLEEEGLQGGLSWPFDDLMCMPYAYEQAKAAVALSTGALTDYASVFPSHIFTLPSEQAFHHLHPGIYKLEAYDRTHEGNLLDTLQLYLSGSEQTADVAAKLLISRSTLFYRINRIREICGVELTMGEERLNLLLSLHLLKLLKANENYPLR